MELRIFFGLGIGEMSGARVLVRCFSLVWTGDGLFCCSLLNDGRFCCLFSQPPSTQVPGICSPVLLFDVTTYLVYIWSRFFGGSLWKMLSPKMMSLFSCNLPVVFFPLSPLLASQWFILVVCPAEKRRKERETVYFPFHPTFFTAATPWKNGKKKKFQSNVLNCVYCRVIICQSWSLVCCLLS